ncbi:hypothetical protein BO78DRAFT_415539 [Aspergillus sclerotiicarbonarius CBS 121057]|uniref:Alpha/beta-hydrolase n=1 Tax=Aspergillus sclerotiicarbonarius (strain CBS 121057 / IBT 28362) TaxID=1448318 RepID=A0A319EIW8_ASPSB|nr:hypothetical protein BO78DRAFT_415539 [Aspergillus sclerotiicarbonarius CBS 121057]
MSGRTSPVTWQPAKTIYILYFTATTLVQTLLLSVAYLCPRLRPLPTWSWKASMVRHITRFYFEYSSRLQVGTTLSLAPGHEGANFITIPPREKGRYTGFLNDPRIVPERIGATWYPVRYSRETDCEKKVVLHFHGGAFAALTDNGAVSCGPLISPTQAPFYTPVPLFMLASTGECLHEEIIQFDRDMRAVGNRIELCEVRDVAHDPYVSAWAFGCQAEVEQIMGEMWKSIRGE